MTTQHHARRRLTREAHCQHVAACRYEAAIVERFFQQACRIVVGRAVAGQDPIVQPYLGRQAVECETLLRSQCVARKQTCRRELVVRKLLNPAIMVSAYGRQRQRLKRFESLSRPQRAGDAIAKVDRTIDATRLDVGQHRLERGKVAVDIGMTANRIVVLPSPIGLSLALLCVSGSFNRA